MKKLITLVMTGLFALSMNVFAEDVKPADAKAEVKKEAPAKPAHEKKEHKAKHEKKEKAEKSETK
jgi:hypothetical protein